MCVLIVLDLWNGWYKDCCGRNGGWLRNLELIFYGCWIFWISIGKILRLQFLGQYLKKSPTPGRKNRTFVCGFMYPRIYKQTCENMYFKKIFHLLKISKKNTPVFTGALLNYILFSFWHSVNTYGYSFRVCFSNSILNSFQMARNRIVFYA